MKTRWNALSAALLLVAGGWGSASAQTWPSKTIRAVVPLSAGSATDIVARTVLEQVSKQMGQAIIIENRTGAGNTIAMNLVAKADPDGYTILVNSAAHTMKQRAIYTSLPFDTARDLSPIIPLGNVPTVLVVQPEKGYKTIHDLVGAAKAKSGAINYSSTGAGNSPISTPSASASARASKLSMCRSRARRRRRLKSWRAAPISCSRRCL